jgi:hypothetical protein
MEIGRAECDITIPDASVSRRHAVIESAHGGFSISDLGSSYGTFVNGRLIRETTPLFFGAMINIGSVMMVFSSGADGSLPDLTACTIGDRYTLTRKLRESAKGAAYAAADRNVRSEVAIKLLSPHLAGLPGYREQFDREIEIAGQLSHPNICRVLDSGPASIRMKDGSMVESIFLTYPLMAGGNLADRLAARDAVPLDRAVQWIETLAAALLTGTLLGDTTLDSKWVLREIDLAHQFGKPMIPIRQESFDDSVTHGDAAVRALLRSQGVPLLDVHNEYVEEAIARVATLITRAIRKDRDD